MSSEVKRHEIRTAAFSACPDTGCDWSSFYRGWLAAREEYNYAALEAECERLQEALASDACQYARQDWFAAPDLSEWFAADDALFMAAASPFAVLAIISRLRAAEMDAQRYRWLRERGDACQWMNIIRIDLDEFVCQDNALDLAIDTAMKGEQQ